MLYNAVDFDDLITKPLELFETRPEVLAHYRVPLPLRHGR